jgi:hypothetical protein
VSDQVSEIYSNLETQNHRYHQMFHLKNIWAKNDLRGARYCTNIDIHLCVQESEILMETQLFSIVLHKTAIYLYLIQLSCNPRITAPKSTLVVYISI